MISHHSAPRPSPDSQNGSSNTSIPHVTIKELTEYGGVGQKPTWDKNSLEQKPTDMHYAFNQGFMVVKIHVPLMVKHILYYHGGCSHFGQVT